LSLSPPTRKHVRSVCCVGAHSRVASTRLAVRQSVVTSPPKWRPPTHTDPPCTCPQSLRTTKAGRNLRKLSPNLSLKPMPRQHHAMSLTTPTHNFHGAPAHGRSAQSSQDGPSFGRDWGHPRRRNGAHRQPAVQLCVCHRGSTSRRQAYLGAGTTSMPKELRM
jgi:hypothetical protein